MEEEKHDRSTSMEEEPPIILPDLPTRTKIGPESFTTLKLIGKGSYAKVTLVKKIDDGKVYAMKILKKKRMKKPK